MAPEPIPGVTDEMVLAAASAAQTPPRLMLELFEGPLDLLLHLIRTNEISITDIPILEICRQYDAYLGLMHELNLEVAGEFLVMAASLAHIKSRMLLPASPTAPGEQPEDPRADLVRQLLEYQRVKAAAEMLRDRDETQAEVFGRGHGGAGRPAGLEPAAGPSGDSTLAGDGEPQRLSKSQEAFAPAGVRFVGPSCGSSGSGGGPVAFGRA